jgi:hypothetical protein
VRLRDKEQDPSHCHIKMSVVGTLITYAKVQTPLATPNTIMAPIPHKTLTSPTRGTAPLGDFDEDELESDEPLPAGAVGVNTDDALAKHDVAAALAEDTSEGAVVLTVALPAKLQDCGLRLLAW